MTSQELHDVLREVGSATIRLHTILQGDFPDTFARIKAWVGEEYSSDPLRDAFVAAERAVALADELVRR